MKQNMIKLISAVLVGLCVFVFFGCPTAYRDLSLFGGGVIEAEDGKLYGPEAIKSSGEGTANGGECVKNLKDGEAGQGYLELVLPSTVSQNSYTVKFRYATGNDSFAVKFTVNGGDTISTGTGAKNDWNFGAKHDLLATAAKVRLKGGDELKIWAADYGAIDYLYLEP